MTETLPFKCLIHSLLFTYREDAELFGWREDTEVTALVSCVDIPTGSDLTPVDMETVVVGVVRTVVAAVVSGV